MKKYKKILNRAGLLIMGILLVLNIFLVPQVTHALNCGVDPATKQDIPCPDPKAEAAKQQKDAAAAKAGGSNAKTEASYDSSSSSSSVATDLIQGLSKMNKLLQVVFWPVLLMIGSLMQNDILFGAGAESRLLEIWVNVRNIVNILFVLVLLGIAFYNVVGEAAENYHLKTIIPKFIIALIAVNFTFIGIKIVLDAVNIVSTAIFALPNSVENTLNAKSKDDPTRIGMFSVEEIDGMCSSIYAADVGTQKYIENVDTASKKGPTICGTSRMPPKTGSFLNPASVSFFDNLNSNNAALAMAITFQKANLLDQVYGPDQKINLDTISVNMLFSIVLYVVFGTAYVALFVTMLVRVVMLWIMIAISPLMVLPYVLPEKLKSMLGEGDLVSKMMKTVMVPIPVSIVMAVGFVMLQGLEKADYTADKLIKTPTLSLDLLTSGLSTLQQLLVALGATAFIWVGVFTALKGTYADHIMEGIKSTVGGAAKGLTKFALGSIPILPVRKGKMASIGALSYALGQIPSKAHQKFAKEAEEDFPEWMSKGGESARKIGEAKNWGEVDKELRKVSKSGAKQAAGGVATYVKKNPGDKQKLKAALEKAGYRKDVDEWIKEAEAGTISETDAQLLWPGMGIKSFAAESGDKGGPGDETNKAEGRVLKDDLKKGYMEGATNYEGKPIKPEDLDKIVADSKSKDKPTADKANAKLKEITDKVEANKAKPKGGGMDATVRNAVAGAASAESFDAVENAMEKTLETGIREASSDPANKGFTASQLKEAVLKQALKQAKEDGMTPEKHKELMEAAKKAGRKVDETLFAQIYPAAPSAPAATTTPTAATTPAAKPAAATTTTPKPAATALAAPPAGPARQWASKADGTREYSDDGGKTWQKST